MDAWQHAACVQELLLGSSGSSRSGTQKHTNSCTCMRMATLPLSCSVATVLKAVCVATNTKVIIKAYYKSKMHPKHYHKLQREIDAMKALNGPYVTEFYAHFEDTQCIYIVMEFCEGGDLFKTMLMHGGLLDEQWVCVEVRMRPRVSTVRGSSWRNRQHGHEAGWMLPI
jgi:hypothetical protein